MSEEKTIQCQVYRLTDAEGNFDYAIVKEGSDKAILIGIGSDGKHHQFDSEEIYHSFKWAEKHGMKVEMAETHIKISDLFFS